MRNCNVFVLASMFVGASIQSVAFAADAGSIRRELDADVAANAKRHAVLERRLDTDSAAHQQAKQQLQRELDADVAANAKRHAALERQVAGLKHQQAEAEKALAECEDKAIKAGNRDAFAARLGVCVEKLVKMNGLSEQLQNLEKNLEEELKKLRNDTWSDVVEADNDLKKKIQVAKKELNGKIGLLDRRAGRLESGWPQAELMVGLVATCSDCLTVGSTDYQGRFAFGAGLSLPVANGDGMLQAEVLGSKGSGTIGFILIGRGLTAVMDSSFVCGLNVRFHMEGPTFSQPANMLFVGVGGSAGWFNKWAPVILDVVVGSKVERVGQAADYAWTSSLLVQKKF